MKTPTNPQSGYVLLLILMALMFAGSMMLYGALNKSAPQLKSQHQRDQQEQLQELKKQLILFATENSLFCKNDHGVAKPLPAVKPGPPVFYFEDFIQLGYQHSSTVSVECETFELEEVDGGTEPVNISIFDACAGGDPIVTLSWGELDTDKSNQPKVSLYKKELACH